jgi:hypothetical protein
MDRIYSPGLQLVFIGVVHELLLTFLGWPHILAALAEGYVATSGLSLEWSTIFWSLQFGLVVILLGLAVRALEGRGAIPLPIVAGVAFMALSGGLAMPVSGFWLALVPVGVMLSRHLSTTAPDKAGAV